MTTRTTQKGKGIRAIKFARLDNGVLASEQRVHGMSSRLAHNTFIWPQQRADVEDLMNRQAIVFARPCPSRPRHGYFESVPIPAHSLTDWVNTLNIIYNKIKANDPDGELLIMPFFQAEYSAVVTPYSFHVGDGNDGVTSGKSAFLQLNFPHTRDTTGIGMLGTFFNELPEELGIESIPYFEILYKGRCKPELVQVRDGIAPSLGSNYYAPEQCDLAYKYSYTYTKDDIENMDMLEWERMTRRWGQQNKRNKNKRWIILPKHTSMASHMGLHCMLNEIPVVFKYSPEYNTVMREGTVTLSNVSTIPATEWTSVAVRSAIINAVRNNTVFTLYQEWIGQSVPRTSSYEDLTNALEGMLNVALVCAHHGVCWNGKALPFLFQWLVMYIRISAAICYGELRHFSRTAVGEGKRTKPPKSSPTDYLPIVPAGRDSREATWLQGLYFGWADLGGALGDMIEDFNEPSWPSTYGGKNWAYGTTQILELYRQINDMTTQGYTYEKMQTLLVTWHASINATHNGKVELLTKIVSRNTLILAEMSPVQVLMQGMAPVMMSALIPTLIR